MFSLRRNGSEAAAFVFSARRPAARNEFRSETVVVPNGRRFDTTWLVAREAAGGWDVRQVWARGGDASSAPLGRVEGGREAALQVLAELEARLIAESPRVTAAATPRAAARTLPLVQRRALDLIEAASPGTRLDYQKGGAETRLAWPKGSETAVLERTGAAKGRVELGGEEAKARLRAIAAADFEEALRRVARSAGRTVAQLRSGAAARLAAAEPARPQRRIRREERAATR